MEMPMKMSCCFNVLHTEEEEQIMANKLKIILYNILCK